MERKTSPDKWHQYFIENARKKWPPYQDDPKRCRVISALGPSTCSRPVVRSGYCVLHSPKLTKIEMAQLSASERAAENLFEKSFLEALLDQIEESQTSGSLNLRAIHFPQVPWNEKPWVNFRGMRLDFGMAVFHQPTSFSPFGFSSTVNFFQAVFRDKVTFCSGTFSHDIEFEDTVFEGDVSFMSCEFHRRTRFTGVRFLANVQFDWSRINGVISFNGGQEHTMFHSVASFRNLQLDDKSTLVFQSLSLRKASFAYTNIERFVFRTISWPARVSHSPIQLSPPKMLWDEIALLSMSIDPNDYDAVAQNYNQLVLSHESRRDFDTAEDFHIGEMEVRRLARGISPKNRVSRHFRRLINPLSLYSVLSWYGSSYWQAFAVLIVLIVIFTIGFLFTGLNPSSQSSASHGFRYVLANPFGTKSVLFPISDLFASFTHTLSILTFQRDRNFVPGSTVSHLWQSLASIALTGQTALFLLAIRRRFKR